MVSEHELIESILYKGQEGAVVAEFLVDKKNQTFWASQQTVADIFETTPSNISKHMSNIFQEGELNENEVSISSKKLFEGQGKFIEDSSINSKKAGRPTKWYNLDAIIASGYRVNSKKATEFRIWATDIIKQYMVKGFVLDKELLKNGTRFGEDYFDELLEDIKEIRTSERRTYQKVTDIYATSYDYEPNAKISMEFFATVQNKLHFAVTEKTASELIADRVDPKKPNMGLTTWDKAPDGKIRERDVITAKNVLNKDEIGELQNITNMLLDFAETQARRQNPMSMKDWVEGVDSFLKFYKYPVLHGKGKISREKADEIAKEAYKKYRPIQDKLYKSDYDKFEEKAELIKKINNT